MVELDGRIEREVVERLYRDGRINVSRIRVSVADGTVVLRGSVSSHENRQIAVADAWSVNGVTQVRDEMAVEYEEPLPTDEEIAVRAGRILEWNPGLDHTTIHVEVSGGILILEGPVPSYWKKLKVEQLVSQITGVLKVKNRLAVVPSHRMNDEALARDVGDAIERSPDVPYKDIDVRVEGGMVILSGIVPTGISRNAAFEAAVYTAGTMEVRNEITVEPMIRGT